MKVCRPASISVTLWPNPENLIYSVILGIRFVPKSSTVQDEGKKIEKGLITDFGQCFRCAVLATEYLEDKV